VDRNRPRGHSDFRDPSLLRQQWRTSINRFAEAMTLFAVSCAGIFPLIHMGRPWLAYWLFPYPDTMKMWPISAAPWCGMRSRFNLRNCFGVVLVHRAASRPRDAPRPRQNPVAKIIYGFLAMGWRGSAVHWYRHETASLLLAGLATPLVLSVHTIVSFDFAFAIVPGWHATISSYFVAGAIYAGFAMVLTLSIPCARFLAWKISSPCRHLDNMGKVLLATGLIVGYGYMMEAFSAYYSGNEYERFMILNRMGGPYAIFYWCLVACNIVTPQFLWSRKVRFQGGRTVRDRHGGETWGCA